MSDMGEPASHRWYRGFLRLYLVVAAFWLIGFGYTAYDANHRTSAADRRIEEAIVDNNLGNPAVFNMDEEADERKEQTLPSTRSRYSQSEPRFCT